METSVNEIDINGITYVKKGSEQPVAVDKDYVIIRSRSAGVFAGNLVSRDVQEVEMSNCRRLWYWDGAASLSQLAIDGVAAPLNCKFSMPVPEQIILEVIEVIPCTEKAI